ncbi:MAG: VOC family protein [Polyangiaceae bacterium]
MQLQANAVRIFVRDLPRALHFYRDDLGLAQVGGANEVGYWVFSSGSLNLIVESVDPSDAEASALLGRFVGLSFRVDDIHQAVAELKRVGAHISGEPELQAWGGTLAHFDDPDGNRLSLVQDSKGSETATARLEQALLFVKDLPRMRDFYRGALGLEPLAALSSEGFCVLAGGAARLALHAIPEHIARGIEITDPPFERSQTPIKLMFQASDLAALCERVERHGGRLRPARDSGSRDAIDPEGNVLSLNADR